MKKFDYKIINCRNKSDNSIMEELKKYGELGWELISVDDTKLHFKRETGKLNTIVSEGDYVRLLTDEESCAKGEIAQISKVIKVYGEPNMTEYYIEGKKFIERDGSLGEPLFLYADEFEKIRITTIK